MINIRRKRQDEFIIDVSSLVDVLFTLLIFFSLSSTFIQETGIKVDLPEASSTGSVASPKKMEIMITSDGSVIIDDNKTDMDQLKKIVSKFDNTDKLQYLVVLKADTATMHGKVTMVLDMLKQTGFKNIAIATRAHHE